MDIDVFVDKYPVLWHMAELGSFPAITEHGLLSTSALLDLFEINGDERFAIESCHRANKVPISHAVYGTAVVRDQKPLLPGKLVKLLDDGVTAREWYELLNRRVFFWVSELRLNKMLAAGAYRDEEHTVLELDTALLVSKYHDSITLSSMNSGATYFMASRENAGRGLNTFRAFDEVPNKELERVVELAVDYAVPDVADMVLDVSTRKAPS